MRAKSRAMAVSIGAALVVVPLSGAAAVAISGDKPATPAAEAVSVQGTEFAGEVGQVSAPVSAQSDAPFTVATPTFTVTVNPKPVVRTTTSTPSSPARAVANSATLPRL